mmetsp:Transcript_28389/g.60750  ORF Transcript_28389/g.60750 Transcript_28389/m.60750 type:complete len:82 (-) Transcript_28389:98-343(-)
MENKYCKMATRENQQHGLKDKSIFDSRIQNHHNHNEEKRNKLANVSKEEKKIQRRESRLDSQDFVDAHKTTLIRVQTILAN